MIRFLCHCLNFKFTMSFCYTEGATEFDREQFLKEIDLMKTISESSNPHVINMVGSSTLTDPLLLIIEYMQYGDLLNYLKSCRDGVGHTHHVYYGNKYFMLAVSFFVFHRI